MSWYHTQSRCPVCRGTGYYYTDSTAFNAELACDYCMGVGFVPKNSAGDNEELDGDPDDDSDGVGDQYSLIG